MDQPRAVERTRLEKLLQHYDIKDFIRFLAKKKFLSAFEHTLLSRLTKKETINHLAKRDQLEGGLMDIFLQYTNFVFEDVNLVLSEILRDQRLFPPKQESDSDSFSSSSFSEDSDPGQYSQESPNDISECSAIVDDPGYCTQSNSLGCSLTNDVQLPSPEYLEATSRQLQPATMHPSRPKKNRRSGHVYFTTNNYFNSVPMNSSLPLTQHWIPNQGYSAATDTDSQFSLQSPVYEKIENFKLVLQKCNRELIECLNVRSLLPYLIEQELLTSDEYETLKMGTRNEQNQSLLHILPSKGEHACKRFLKCLNQEKEHLGHKQLATRLSGMI